MPLTTGRTLLALVAFTTSIGGYIADWNETHVYNPRWPPHAKFHNGQTMSTGLLLGVSALYYLFRPASSSALAPDAPASSRALEHQRLHFATWLLSLNWFAQLSAVFYPGSLPVDPEFGGGFPQAYICAVLFAFIGAGFWVEKRRIEGSQLAEKEL